MFLFILSILLFVVSIIGFVYMNAKKIEHSALSFGVTALSLVLLVSCLFSVVPTGQTGILVTMGKVEDRTLEAGLNVVMPWQDVVLIDNREQKISFSESAFSSDIQQADIQGSVVFSVNKLTAMDLYRNVGKSYIDIIIKPQVSENIKSVISTYTAEQLISERSVLSVKALEMLREDLSSYGLNIVSVAIENIDFSDAFEKAVEDKTVAAQNKQRALVEQEQMTMEAQQAADRLRIQAQADADVAKIQAEAAKYAGEREAEMNRKLSESLTPELVNYYYAQKWDGKLPATYIGGSGENIVPVLDVQK